MKAFKNTVLVLSFVAAVVFGYLYFTAPEASASVGYTQQEVEAEKKTAVDQAVASGKVVYAEEVDKQVEDKLSLIYSQFDSNPYCTEIGKVGKPCYDFILLRGSSFSAAGGGGEENRISSGTEINLADGLLTSGEEINVDWKVRDLHPGTPDAGWMVIAPVDHVRYLGLSSDPGQVQVIDPSGNILFPWDSQGKGYTAWFTLPAGHSLRFRTGWNDANEYWNVWVEEYRPDALGSLAWKGDPKSLHDREDKPLSWEWSLFGLNDISSQ